MTTEILYKEESYRIIGACFEVYKEKGHGFLESVYQECLALELATLSVPFEQQRTLKLDYKGHPLRQTYEPDLLCYNDIIIEIKAVKQLTDDHRAQTINYLKATGKSLGLLVNFGHYPGIQHERFLNQSSRDPRDDISRISNIS